MTVIQSYLHPPVHICFTIDEPYVAYMAVCMASILDNADGETRFNFHIISAGLSPWMERKLLELRHIKECSIEFITIDHSQIAGLPSYGKRSSHINDVSLYRLKLASLLPELDKVIYLDVDTVSLTNIARLWAVDLTDHHLAAVADSVFAVESAGLSPEFRDWRTFHKSMHTGDYVNAGVLLINLQKWRMDKVEELFLHLSAEYGRHFLFPDQDLLNIAFSSTMVRLNCRWNVPIDIMKNFSLLRPVDPYIIHWAGERKPWNGTVDEFGESIFWHYASLTPFFCYLTHAWTRTTLDRRDENLKSEMVRHNYWLRLQSFVRQRVFKFNAVVLT